MERSNTRRQRYQAGGIIGLAKFVNEHSEALNYDLMTRTIYQIDDAGGALSWSALYSFIKNLRGDSALARDLGKSTGWEDTLRTNTILADIFDLLQNINFNIVALANSMNGKKTKKQFTPYPRPGAEDNTKRKLGKDALPLPKLREWMQARSKQNGNR